MDAKYLPARFRVRDDLDEKLSYLSLDVKKSKQELAEEAILDLLKKYQDLKKNTK